MVNDIVRGFSCNCTCWYRGVQSPRYAFTASHRTVADCGRYQLPRVDREPPRFQYYLRITTSDGGRLQFIAPTNDVVEHVRRIIADRINQDDQTTTYTVNFNNGAIASGSSASTGNVVRGVPIAQNTQPIFPHEHRVPGKVALGNPLNALHAQPIEHLFKPARYCESCDLEQPFPSPSCTKMRLKLSQL
jgi:hypothetical protein